MSQILKKIQDVDPNNSEAIKEALSPFLQNLSKHTEDDCIRWLRTLENVINRFPKYCMSQRGNIETYLSHFLDSTNFYIVIEAAKCAHALQQVRPVQEKTATAKSTWRDLMCALCNAAHSLISALFPHAVDIFQNAAKVQLEQKEPTSELTKVLLDLNSIAAKTQNNNVFKKEDLLSNRLRNVFVFVQAMLVEIYPVPKPIRPQDIFELLVRALSVTSATNSLQTLSDVVMVKLQALRTLDAAIACLGPNLIPFSALVFKFGMQTLKWTAETSNEQTRKVRTATYSTMKNWLSTLQTYTMAQDKGKWEDELTNHIINDITPPKHVVELKMSSQPTKNLSKKAKKKLANTMLQDSSLASHMPGEKNKVAIFEEINDEVAVAALECAETFLNVCGVFLKPTTHKRFQERLVRECFTLDPYSPRLLPLLQCLEATRTSTPAQVPPPTQYCMQIYSVLSNCRKREIANFSSQALLNIKMHLHCAPPSLNFAIDVQPEVEKEKEDRKKRISEKNRAALAALLGEDKIPKISEEIITIPDEPSNKRRKLDSESASVASDQIESVQISDDDDDIQEVEMTEVISKQSVIENIVKNSNINIHGKETQLLYDTNNDETEDNGGNIEEEINLLISEDKVDSTQPEKITIHEEKTQIPINTSQDDEDPVLSMEVVYDLPNTGNTKVTILDKLEGDNLPSSNETDDIQITCGQIVKSSQDGESDKHNDLKSVEIKVNGFNKSPEKPLQNGDVSESGNTGNITKEVTVTVEDMLADFVDEVNEDTQASIPA